MLLGIVDGNTGFGTLGEDDEDLRYDKYEVDLEDYVSRPDKISAADIHAICQEAGMHAVRKNRYVILPKDLEKGYKANVKKSDNEFAFYK